MHIENIRATMEILANRIKTEFSQGIECVDVYEMSQATDMIKDLAEAEYYSRISVAMESAENEESEAEKYMLKQLISDYGEDDGRRYYDNYRYTSSGRFAPKGKGTYTRGYSEPYWYMTPKMYHDELEHYRDMDRSSRGKMYYTESVNHAPEMKMSRYENKKRAYTESKGIHKANTAEDKQEKMKSLEEYMREVADDITTLLNEATPEEKNLARTKIQTIAQKLV